MENKKKSKNTIIKDTIALFLITMIAGLALGFVYDITKKPIEVAKLNEKQEAYQAVYQDAKTFEKNDSLSILAKNAEEVLKEAEIDGVVIDEVLEAKDESGTVIGYVLSVTSSKGYGGDITISLGVSSDGTVLGMKTLILNETAGLGAKAKEAEFRDQYQGKKVESFKVVKTGKKADDEIDAISAATITSSAVTDAVNGGIYFVNNCAVSN